MRIRLLTTGVIIFCAAASLPAQVGDPTLRTDHPLYAGEGAFQTIEDCVAFATTGKSEPQGKAIALYNWLLAHQWHLASPREWCIPGRNPDTQANDDDENVVYDANIGRFSYGYGLCGTVHAWNEPYWKSLGMNARRRAFPGHTNSEVLYDGRWHAFDTDMAGLLFRPDGIVAGYDDIIADPSLVDATKPPHPHYPFAWPGDFNTMKRGWQQVAAGGHWYPMYNGGYAAQPGIVNLRAGETFTRWYDPDRYGGPTKRRFWHHMQHGPQRPWSFYNQSEPKHDGESHNARNDVAYCNGEFVYQPDIEKHVTRNGERLTATFTHWSPYVIAGDPADDANPMTGPATGGLVMGANLAGNVQLEVATDRSTGFQSVPQDNLNSTPNGSNRSATQRHTLDLTEFVKGRFGWQVRCSWTEGDADLANVEFTTVTQVSPAIYPRLTPNGCDVTYHAASRAIVAVIPNFGLPESEIDEFEAIELRSPNVTYHGRSEDSRFAYRTNDNKPGHIVFKVNSPQPLTEVRAAIRYQIRVPPPENADYHLDISTDNGQTWQTFAQADIPADNEFSSGWLAGQADMTDADVTNALVRIHLDADGHKTALIDARLYGIYRTPDSGPLMITYGWTERGQSQQHTETVAAGTPTATFTVPTGANVEDEFVRLFAE